MNSERFEKGLEIRRSVLGAEYVDKSIENASDFSMPDAAIGHRILLG